jgi:hypothetical protein
MRLETLHPRLKENVLVFDCPCGQCGGRVRVPVADEKVEGKWKTTGIFPNLTLDPSINAGCWHGNITNGEVTTCQ